MLRNFLDGWTDERRMDMNAGGKDSSLLFMYVLMLLPPSDTKYIYSYNPMLVDDRSATPIPRKARVREDEREGG